MVSSASREPFWSVIVATRDRHRQLAQLVKSLLASEGDTPWEAIVVDQSSALPPDDLRALLEDGRVTYVRQSGKGKSRALNLALGLARGEALAFTDDDCLVSPHWLRTGCQALERAPDVALLFGQMLPVKHNTSEEFIPEMQFSQRAEYSGRPWMSRGLIGMGGCMFGRRTLILEAGGFDEDLGPGGALRTGEEVELTYRLLRQGFRIVREPKASVLHCGARRVQNGDAAKLVNDGFYAVAAGLGKNAARGDWAAGVAAAHELTRVLLRSGRSIVTLRRPFHLRRLGMNVSGFLDGWRYGWRERRIS